MDSVCQAARTPERSRTNAVLGNLFLVAMLAYYFLLIDFLRVLKSSSLGTGCEMIR